jgi:phage tail-like protein
MATAIRQDPLLGHNFQVSLIDSGSAGADGSGLTTLVLSTVGVATTAGFSEISGLEMTMEVEEYPAGGINDRVLKFPGRLKWSNLVMKRGVIARRTYTDRSDLWTWVQTFIDGVGIRKDGLITLLDEARTPQLVWGWRRGLPLKWTGATMNAAQSQVAIEQIEISHEGLYQIQGGGALGSALSGLVNAL